MRASFYNRYDSINDSSSEPISVNIVGPLLLHADPVDPLHASTKRYVDGVFTGGLDATSITSEILSTDFMPEFTGDATCSQGSNVFTLASTGVAPGNYKKLTVNSKGLVTSANQLSPEDIPLLTWNKITSGKPVSIVGYGITDAIRSTGDSLVGTVRVQAPPTADLHAATRQYVELRLQDIGTNEPVGTILEKTTNITPTNFLRCNGGELSKTTYADLYAVIGDRFSPSIEPGTGRPWENGSDWLNTTVDITSWTAGVALPVGVSRTQLVVTKNFVYIVGNYVASNSANATIYRGVINDDGTITSWSVAGSAPYAVYWPMTCIAKNRLYFIGGCTNGTSSVYNLVRSCAILSDGSLDPVWRTETGVPVNLFSGKAFFFRNRIYVVGHSANGVIYSAPIDNNGVVGTWSIAGTPAIGVYLASVTIIKDKLYIFGGLFNGTPYSNIQMATINDDGSLSAFTTVGNLPVTLYTGTFANTKNEIYLIGGIANGAYHSNIYKASINADGTLGSWTTVASLPSNQANNMAFFTKNKLYLIGNSANSGTSAATTVYYASMTGTGGVNDYTPYNDGTYEPMPAVYNPELLPGSGKPWEQQYSTNIDQTNEITNWVTAGDIPVAKHACLTIATKNRVYLIGGSTGSISSAVHSAPINADGTLGSWVAGTSLPAAVYISQAVVTKNRVYILGGSNGSATANIYTAPINTDGTLGTWVAAGTLPTVLAYSVAFITKNKLYLLGGSTGGAILNTIYVATIGSDGLINNWSQAGSLPTVVYCAQVAVTKNRVYLIGGNSTGSVSSGSAAVYSAPINQNGTLGNWTVESSLPGSLQASSVFVSNSRVYLFGGLTGGSSSSVTNAVYSAPVNTDGTLGAWVTNTNLPIAMSFSNLVATSNRIYLLGGHNGSGVFSTIYSATIAGGSNDYSSAYDGSYVAILEQSKFRLPDLSTYETHESNFFIRY